MPRDGSGVHSLDPGYLAVTGATVLPSNHNPPLEDLSNAITESIARTGVTSITADIPFNGKKITGLGNGTDDADAINLGQSVARFTNGIVPGVSVSAAGNALTISLLTSTGDTPSSDSPVSLAFRSATATLGTTVLRNVSTATTLTISSGSTLGVTGTNTAFSVYVVAFDDGGTIRLGVINRDKTLPLMSGIASATAEGGAGAADTAQIFYSSASISSKAYVVLARLYWESGLATLGAWTAPTLIDCLGPLSSFAETGSVAPQPLSKTTASSDVGYITSINTAAGNGYVIPSGGSWEYMALVITAPGGIYGGTNYVGVAAGGTTIPGASGYVLVGRAKRIA